MHRVAEGGLFTKGSSTTSTERLNLVAGLWHAAFLALGMALTQPTTVIAAFVAELTGSTVWVGGFSTVLIVAATLPQLFVARLVEPRAKKKPFLLLAIYLRVVSWGVLAWLVYAAGGDHPDLLMWALIGLLVVFYAGGGLGNIPYTDIVGKVIPATRRGFFFGGKAAVAGPLSVGAALLARRILATAAYPNNYALLFGLAAISLTVASLGFLVIREPASAGGNTQTLSWRAYWQHLVAGSRRLKTLVVVQLLTGVSLMATPFYVVYGRDVLAAPADAVGWFLVAQVIGGVLGNLLWARLVDRFGYRNMLTACATGSAAAPVLALALGHVGWLGLLPSFVLAGAATGGRIVGFQSALLSLAPASERPTFAALNAVLILPVALMPLLSGLLLEVWSFGAIFAIAAGFVALGAIATRRL